MSQHELASAPIGLNRGERNALGMFRRHSAEFVAVSRWPRIGLPSLRSLVSKGLAVEGPSGTYGPTFRLTGLGREVADQLRR
jgi:hypothetical protein